MYDYSVKRFQSKVIRLFQWLRSWSILHSKNFCYCKQHECTHWYIIFSALWFIFLTIIWANCVYEIDWYSLRKCLIIHLDDSHWNILIFILDFKINECNPYWFVKVYYKNLLTKQNLHSICIKASERQWGDSFLVLNIIF